MSHNFAIFVENVRNRDRHEETMYQAHGWTMSGWMPVAPPVASRHLAHTDAWDAWKELKDRGLHGGHPFKLAPQLQRYDWIERRQL